MKKLTAFVARSFDPNDDAKIKTILDHLDSFRNLGFLWQTADKAEVESVSAKVRRMIDESDIFVGILTKRHRVVLDEGPKRWTDRFRRRHEQSNLWTPPSWILQEMGYALNRLGLNRLIIFREEGVDLPSLQGDLEYVPYRPYAPASALQRTNEMINGLIAAESGIVTEFVVRQQEAVAAPATSILETIATPQTTETLTADQSIAPTDEEPNIG